jgi:hypothetical protein
MSTYSVCRLLPHLPRSRRSARTADQIEMCTFQPTVYCYDRCSFDEVSFRTVSGQVRTNCTRTDNSGVMMLYQGEQEGVQEHAYGRLINIMEHHLFEDGPVLVFAEFEWYTCVRKMFSGRVQIVKANPRDRWNLDSTGYRFDVFSEIVPQHVTYEPLDGHVGNQGGELMAIYRGAQLHFNLAGA